MVGNSRVAWFLRQQPGATINFVDVSIVASASHGPGGCRIFDLDVPEDAFDKMMERAAKHPGYSASSLDLREIRTRDTTLSFEMDKATHAPAKVRVTRSSLVDACQLQGSQLLVRRYQRTPLQLPMFPHSAAPHTLYRARRLLLRIHRFARLVFESRASDAGRSTRRVRVEIELRPNLGDADIADLQRTVENTIQVVLLGYKALVGGGDHSTLPYNVEQKQ